MPEQKVLICMPVDHPGYVVTGSLHYICQECHQGVWVAPSSWLVLHEAPGMEVLCWRCGFAKMEKVPGEIMGITPAQREEIGEYLRI